MTQARGDVRNGEAEGEVERKKNTAADSLAHGLVLLDLHPWLLCVLLIGLSMILACLYLGRPGIWFDEAFSVELARQPLPLLWHTIFGTEPNMELYYLLLHGWLMVTGWLGLAPVEWLVRLPSAICAALSTGVIFLFARRYLGTVAAAVGSVLFASNYLLLVYAQQTRAYALQLLLLCLSWLALLTAIQRETSQKRWWALYVATIVLAIYSHLFSAFVLLAQWTALAGLYGVSVDWRAVIRRQWLFWMGSLLLSGVLSIPMLLVSLHGSKTGWLFVPHLSELLSLFTIISGSNPRYLVVMGLCILAGLILVAIGSLVGQDARYQQWMERRLQLVWGPHHLRRFWPFAWMMLCWFVLPIVISYVISQGSLRLFSTRYLVVVVPPFCLLAALGVAIWRWRILQGMVICVLLGSAFLVVPHYYQNAQVEDWNSAVHWLQARSQPGDGLVCYDNTTTQGCQIAVEYYLHAYPNGTYFSSDSPGAFSWEKFSSGEPQNDPTLALQPAALSTFASHHPRFFLITGRIANQTDAVRVQDTRRWLDQHYHLLGQEETHTVTVSFYSTATK
ncbi:glycosyltransferase family 39 protein [Dictyobacter aurantiacus]|uniref:Glycosyltransferase RgtA/B/C/D-like domain-containing protein n=1 Tax=Dictyobacter aurantiacus TaxID=1936993 RepID=A0A401ZET5_9CHLR|nr:glycosyltransferase family 39 protein [Dictyobacter aurantiacus]GCE05390.1 hypothetical protein KDAU_27190 [Dictyobacter aurantiacus]